MRFNRRSKINQRIMRSVFKLVSVCLVSVVALMVLKVSGTNSYFTDQQKVSGNTFSAGYWIPELTVTITPQVPDGMNGWYKTKPCVMFEADISDVVVDYTLTETAHGQVKSGQSALNTCVPLTDGNYLLKAVAVNRENTNWKSSEQELRFKVDTTAPEAPEWVSPKDGAITRQSKNILLDWKTVIDSTSGLAGYKYENQGPNGVWKSADHCGLITDSKLPNHQIGPNGSCVSAPVASFSVDGTFKRQVKAVDQAGNESEWSDQWSLTRDTVAPQSQVTAFVQPQTTETTFDVHYTATDDRSGVKQVTLYYQKGEEAWKAFGTFAQTAMQKIQFTAVTPGTYSFYTVAEDRADDLDEDDMAISSAGDNDQGNIEQKTALKEATIIVQENNPSILPGELVINEVMWMGSQGKPDDQWVELKNVSERDLHLKDIYLSYKGANEREYDLYEQKDNRVIKKGEYLLVSYYTKNNSAINVNPDSDDLNDFSYSKFQIKLYLNKLKTTLLDSAGDGNGTPEQGDEEQYFSMQRKDSPGDGTDWDNWYTCLDADSTSQYWDDDRTERGTPGADNSKVVTEEEETTEVEVEIGIDGPSQVMSARQLMPQSETLELAAPLNPESVEPVSLVTPEEEASSSDEPAVEEEEEKPSTEEKKANIDVITDRIATSETEPEKVKQPEPETEKQMNQEKQEPIEKDMLKEPASKPESVKAELEKSDKKEPDKLVEEKKKDEKKDDKKVEKKDEKKDEPKGEKKDSEEKKTEPASVPSKDKRDKDEPEEEKDKKDNKDDKKDSADSQ